MPYDPTLDAQSQALYAAVQRSAMPDSIKQDIIRQFQAQIGARNVLNPNDYFNPDLINQYFNASRGNLLQNQAYARAGAQHGAASIANSRGYLNPGGFITGAGSQAAAPYAGALGSLESSRAGALQNNQQGLYQALFGLMNQNRNYGLQQQQLGLQADAQNAGPLDYASALLPLLNPAYGFLNFFKGGGNSRIGAGTGTSSSDLPSGFSPTW